MHRFRDVQGARNPEKLITLRKINLKGTDFEIEIAPFRFLGFSEMRETERRRRMRGKQMIN